MFTYLTHLPRRLVVGLLLVGCVTVEPSPEASESTACQGPNCVDAGVASPAVANDDNVVAAPVVVAEDAGLAAAVEAGATASFAVVTVAVADCPDQCQPDDPRACADDAALADAAPPEVPAASTNPVGKVLPQPRVDASVAARRGPPLALQDAEVPVPEAQPTSGLSCQVVGGDDGENVASCLPAGFAGVDEVCSTSSDCLAGLACVGAGSCRPYCCTGQAVCEEGSFCETRLLRAPASSADVLAVPVCVPPETCRLDCRPGSDCTCPDGKACTILDAQGTTGCREPGTGEQGQECPCAAGFLCSETFNQCLKICEAANDECDQGHECQGGRLGVPEGWGLCAPSFEAAASDSADRR